MPGAAVAAFGGVYGWGAAALAGAVGASLAWVGPPASPRGAVRVLDAALVAVLAGIALQLAPLPASLLSIVSPARSAYLRASSLQPDVSTLLPLTLDRGATLHAWLAAFCFAGMFWLARAVFARGGIRTVVTAIAWTAIAVVLVALAQGASGTSLVYGFWRPADGGARPLGPFVNRNHCGTWSVLALMLCFGCFEWRRAASAPSRGWRWRARIAHALNGRSLILMLAVLLLTVSVALGASRSALLALACGAGYVAWAAPSGPGRGRRPLRTAAVLLAALLAAVAYADVDRLLSRLDETRQQGLSQRLAIWRDTLGVVRDFPAAGVGAGNFSNAMRVYQTSERTYFWNEAHNQYLQVAAEGGVLLGIPALAAMVALAAAAVRALRRRDDPLHWMRIGASAALVSVAIQAIWETGLSLPANSMLAAVAAAIVVLPVPEAPPSSHAAPGR